MSIGVRNGGRNDQGSNWGQFRVHEMLMFDKNLDETTRIQLSYQSLGNFTRYKRAKPCIHRYLYAFMRSQMVLVPPADWGTALFLPVERFKKMNKTMVWAESAYKMRRIGI